LAKHRQTWIPNSSRCGCGLSCSSTVQVAAGAAIAMRQTSLYALHLGPLLRLGSGERHVGVCFVALDLNIGLRHLAL
jgi:hypothetical protein